MSSHCFRCRTGGRPAFSNARTRVQPLRPGASDPPGARRAIHQRGAIENDARMPVQIERAIAGDAGAALGSNGRSTIDAQIAPRAIWRSRAMRESVLGAKTRRFAQDDRCGNGRTLSEQRHPQSSTSPQNTTTTPAPPGMSVGTTRTSDRRRTTRPSASERQRSR